MDTVTIELTNPKAMNLLEELDKPRLSTLLRSSVLAQVAEEFNESIQKNTQ